MYKKLIMWLFFTIIAGILPIGFKWAIAGITNVPFEYSNIGSEIFFFNVILSADGLKGLYDVDSGKKVKILLFASLIFIIIILSAIYGILLLHDYRPIDLSLDSLYSYSKFFTVCCLVISFSIQLLGGMNHD